MASFLADENFPYPVARALRSFGHQVDVLTQNERGASDTELLARAFASKQILLTQDQDFAEIVLKGGHKSFGILRLRMRDQGDWKARAAHLAGQIDGVAHRLPGAFAVLTDAGITFDDL